MFHSNTLAKVLNFSFSLSPFLRKLAFVLIDSFLLVFSVWLSFWLRLADPFAISFVRVGVWLIPAILLIGLPLYGFTGQYKGLTRYVGSDSFYRLACRNGVLVLFLVFAATIFRLPLPPRSSWFLLFILLTVLTGLVRFALRDLLLRCRTSSDKILKRVIIYGAGLTGVQLSSALRFAGNYVIVSFFDDDSTFWGRTINGVPIQSPSTLPAISDSVDQILLAIPSLSRSERRRIVQSIQLCNVDVLQVPSVNDLASGRAKIDTLKSVAIDDLLGRDPVPPDISLLQTDVPSSVVCITGAGGSIGSELSRQILSLGPSHIILLDHSESALYSIESELRSLSYDHVTIIPVLADASNRTLIRKLFDDYSVEIVFHAAAYKHVPLVECNPLAGLANNIFSTRSLCDACIQCAVRKFVLISTDKAVRPTNIMGASKRVAELIVQASALLPSSTCFSMVRFGNVLGSSGSVVPLFEAQIRSGGPITLTHPHVTRYFMTIPEAAQLVLQSCSLAHGGDVFLLDMGDPIRIKTLAEQMIRLSGLTIRTADFPDGDIEIRCTGLRPGEKLYEELLIDAHALPTQHPLIFRAQEDCLPPDHLCTQLDRLDQSILAHDSQACRKILAELVPQWS